MRTYFLENHSEVRALGFFHLVSALALLCFAVYLQRWVDHRASRLAAVALAGGICAAAFLLLSALVYRTLAEPTVARDPALTHALVVISYLAGGPGIAVPLALPIGAVSTVGLRRALLPRWAGGLEIAAVVFCVLSAGILLGPINNTSVWYGVLLLSAVVGFVWTFVTSLVMAVRVG